MINSKIPHLSLQYSQLKFVFTCEENISERHNLTALGNTIPNTPSFKVVDERVLSILSSLSIHYLLVVSCSRLSVIDLYLSPHSIPSSLMHCSVLLTMIRNYSN